MRYKRGHFTHAAAVGAVIQEIMDEENVTQTELGAMVGYSQVTISRHLAGKHDMPLGLLARICAALNTTPAIVLNRVNSRYRHVAA